MKEWTSPPPLNSDSFYDVGDGKIQLTRNSKDQYFLHIKEGNVYSGDGNLVIARNRVSPFSELEVLPDTCLNVSKLITFLNTNATVDGTFRMMKHGKLYVRGATVLNFNNDSAFTIEDDVALIIEEGSAINISGTFNIHASKF